MPNNAAKPFFRPNNPILIFCVLAIILAGFGYFLSLKAPASFAGQNLNSNLQDAQIPINKTGLARAPELAGISGVINADSNISIASLRGKVVLVDFWTYTCINCIRTLPYLRDWHEKYSNSGLVIVGVHTPEFEFEKEYPNVLASVQEHEIKYPVVQDNDYATWNAFGNHYWPHKYLVDADGYIRYDRIGESGYDETEREIVELLNERDAGLNIVNPARPMPNYSTNFSKIGTPELYLGYQFARAQLGNPEGFRPDQTVSYKFPALFSPNVVYLEGEWKNNSDSMELMSDTGKVALVYTAKNLNIVAGNPNGTSKTTAQIEGAPANSMDAGSDAVVESGKYFVAVNSQKLYNIVSLPDYAQDKEVILSVNGKGFMLYTFTFG